MLTNEIFYFSKKNYIISNVFFPLFINNYFRDALANAALMSEELRLQSLKNLTALLSRTFREPFVFPALGHEDISFNFTQVEDLWRHWLPSEALLTFRKGELIFY